MKSKPIEKITKKDFVPLSAVIKKNMKRKSFRKAFYEEIVKKNPIRKHTPTT
jgi:hypothetical protein